MLFMVTDSPERPRPDIWLAPLVAVTALFPWPKPRLWPKLETELWPSGGCAWRLGVLVLGGEDVEVGVGRRILLDGVEVMLDWEMMAFLGWCCCCWLCWVCCWMAEL